MEYKQFTTLIKSNVGIRFCIITFLFSFLYSLDNVAYRTRVSTEVLYNFFQGGPKGTRTSVLTRDADVLCHDTMGPLREA
jgi:hypothetical protein